MKQEPYLVELTWEEIVEYNEPWGEGYLGGWPETITGGHCKCGRQVTRGWRKCPDCNQKIKFVPFVQIKTDLTLRQFAFLSNHTKLDKVTISNTTKAEAIKIISDTIKNWEKSQRAAYDGGWGEYDDIYMEQPF
jgi:hypothetical protein